MPPNGPKRILVAVDLATADHAEVEATLATLVAEGAHVTLAAEPAAGVARFVAGRDATPLDDERPDRYDLALVIGAPAPAARLLRHPVVAAILSDLGASQHDRRLKTALLAVNRAARDAGSESEFCERALDAFRDFLPSDASELALWDSATRRLTLAAERNMPPDVVAQVQETWRAPDPPGIVATAVRERTLIVSRSGASPLEPRHIAPLAAHHGFLEIASAPLLGTKGEPLGGVAIGTREGFTQSDLERLEYVAAEVGAALEKRRLLQEVERLAAERGKALARLNRSHAELADFTFNLSHDLAEPLRRLATLTGYLREDLRSRVTPEERDVLARIDDTARTLKRMVTGMLEASRAVRASLESRDDAVVDTRELALAAVELLAPVLESRGARVTLSDDLPRATANAFEVERILLNLLRCALDSDPRDPPAIEIGAGERENAPALFVRRTDVPANPPLSWESALTLKLVASLVEPRGGRAWAEGACFWFTLSGPTKAAEDAV